MLVRSKSICVSDMKPTVSTMIVHVGDHGAERELPFEPEPEIDQDRHDREHQADGAVGKQFAGDARPDHLDAAVIDVVAERVAHLLHRRLLRRVAARLLGNADQHVVRARRIAAAGHRRGSSAPMRRAHLGEVGRARLGLHLHQRAADEVDAEIQAVEEIQRDRRRSTAAPKSGKLMRRKRMKSNLVSSGTMRSRRTTVSHD